MRVTAYEIDADVPTSFAWPTVIAARDFLKYTELGPTLLANSRDKARKACLSHACKADLGIVRICHVTGPSEMRTTRLLLQSGRGPKLSVESLKRHSEVSATSSRVVKEIQIERLPWPDPSQVTTANRSQAHPTSSKSGKASSGNLSHRKTFSGFPVYAHLFDEEGGHLASKRYPSAKALNYDFNRYISYMWTKKSGPSGDSYQVVVDIYWDEEAARTRSDPLMNINPKVLVIRHPDKGKATWHPLESAQDKKTRLKELLSEVESQEERIIHTTLKCPLDWMTEIPSDTGHLEGAGVIDAHLSDKSDKYIASDQHPHSKSVYKKRKVKRRPCDSVSSLACGVSSAPAVSSSQHEDHEASQSGKQSSVVLEDPGGRSQSDFDYEGLRKRLLSELYGTSVRDFSSQAFSQ